MQQTVSAGSASSSTSFSFDVFLLHKFNFRFEYFQSPPTGETDTSGLVDDVVRVVSSQGAVGYLVTKAFAPKLMESFMTSVFFLSKGLWYEDYAIDQYWKLLMLNSTWLTFKSPIAYHAHGFSDNEKMSY